MLNYFKKAIFFLWFLLDRNLPFKRGKHRISLVLTSIFGSAIYKIGSIKLALNPHEFFWRNLMSGKFTDRDVEDAIRANLKSGEVFIDIGANIGYFTLIAAVEQRARVFAFEPSSREIKRLYRNFQINDHSNSITLFPYGISDKHQELTLNVSTLAHPGMNSVVRLHDIANVEGAEQVDFYPIGSLISDEVLKSTRVCKIDVEGYEPHVLLGFKEKMPLMPQAIFIIEISPLYLKRIGFEKRFIYQFFEDFGFKSQVGEITNGQYNEVFSKA